MSGGSTSTTQQYTPVMNFAPTSNGGSINIGGSVGVGNANFDGTSTASGASTSFKMDLNMGGGAQPEASTLMLQNLMSYDDLDLMNLAKNAPSVSNMAGNLPGANNLVTKNGVKPLATALDGADYVALYFTGSFCGPCKSFTPVLSKFYNTVNKNGKKIEIVTVPADRSEALAQNYFATMPWMSTEFKDKSKIQ